MKAILLAALLLSSSLAAAPIDDVKERFKGSHIQNADWIQKADYQQAGHSDKYRILNVKLGHKEAMVKIDFTELEKNQLFAAEDYCLRLVDLTPLVLPQTWDETTPDQTAVSKVYTGQLENGETRKDVIKGWEFMRYRMENTIYCSVKRGA